jgi:hypothetical protein
VGWGNRHSWEQEGARSFRAGLVALLHSVAHTRRLARKFVHSIPNFAVLTVEDR